MNYELLAKQDGLWLHIKMDDEEQTLIRVGPNRKKGITARVVHRAMDWLSCRCPECLMDEIIAHKGA